MSRGEVWWGETPKHGRRPYLVSHRNAAIGVLAEILVCPLTRTIRDIDTEVPLDQGVPLTQTPGVSFSGEVTAGSYSPLTLTGAATESFTGGATCGEKVGKKAAQAVKKGAFVGSAVSFE